MSTKGIPKPCPRKSFPLILLFLGVLFLFPGQAFAQEKPVGKVIGISGMIEYFSGASTPVAEAKPGEVRSASFEPWQKVKFQQPVYSKDRYRTSPKSRLKILFDDKSLIALGPNSEFKVESYIYDREQKLRQGVLRMVNGLSMYLINKSQKNKKSSFRIVTPTANVASRGTHGYLSVIAAMTYVANQAGEVGTGNVKHGICNETKVVGAGEGNKIPKNGCPTTAQKLTKDQFYAISNIVLGEIVATSTGSTGSGNKPLITIEEGGVKEGGSEEAGTPETGSSTGGSSTGGSSTGGSSTGGSSTGGSSTGGSSTGGSSTGGSPEIGVPAGGGVDGFGAGFLASVEPIAEFFVPVNEPFNPAILSSCSQ